MNYYEIDNNITFLTIAVGDDYINKCGLLVESIIKFTNSKFYIATDNPELVHKKYVFLSDRINIIDLNKLNIDYKIKDLFNYHLKAITIYELYKLIRRLSIIYIDADAFIFGWNNILSRYILSVNNTLLGRSRGLLSDAHNLERYFKEKDEFYNINYKSLNYPLIIESVLIITEGDKSEAFIKQWYDYALESIKYNLNPFIESYEMALAMKDSQIEFISCQRWNPLSDSFRILHQDKIINPFIN